MTIKSKSKSIIVKHNGKNFKVYKGARGGMYLIRNKKKVYLQNGAGFFGALKNKAAQGFAAAKSGIKKVGSAASSGMSSLGNTAASLGTTLTQFTS